MNCLSLLDMVVHVYALTLPALISRSLCCVRGVFIALHEQ